MVNALMVILMVWSVATVVPYAAWKAMRPLGWYFWPVPLIAAAVVIGAVQHAY